MSRICVKNLPKYVNEDRLREFFSQKGEVTDAKLMRTADGKSRQFGFIGYRTEQEAEEALKYFDKSYLDTCRIFCEVARKVGDPNTPRAWSRYSKEKEEKLNKANNEASDGEKIRHDDENSIDSDPKLQEFLKVMQPRSKSKLWEDDTLVGPKLDKNNKINKKLVQNEDFISVKADGKKSSRAKDVLNDGSESPARDELISDMDYFKSRVKKDWSDSGSSDDDDDNDDSGDNVDKTRGQGSEVDEDKSGQDEQTERESLEEHLSEEFDGENAEITDQSSSIKDVVEGIDTARLFVRNLPYSATEEELDETFRKFGHISQVHLVVDKDTKRSKGFAYVQYSAATSASRALQELDHSIFQGRLLHVMPAKAKVSAEDQQTKSTVNAKTFKQKREDEKKASEAGGNTRSWNSLFMRPDTVVENIARKYGVSKSQFLDREAGDLAVRIALGETQIIAETKAALTNAGVNVGSLEEFASGNTEGMKRSNHVLLVKNLPYSCTDAELSEMFGKFGSLDKIILPPTRTISLVVFLEPAEARAAFRGLAYKRYKDAPLYLEWAPSNILVEGSKYVDNLKDKIAVGENEVKKAKLEQELRGTVDADADPDRVESRSLFVKNLNFKTTDETLRKHFSENMKEGSILSVRIKKHLKNGKNVSMGFGFVEFDSVETAANICRDLQGTVLDGHALILQVCHSKKDDKKVKKAESDHSSTKIIVRNVAFEATEKDLRQLFSPFGQIKSLRLPMRFGNHRGFAFVEFVTKQEAQNALQALSNTHLYGRHLVLERAKEGETLEELRARTAAQFDDQNGFNSSTKVSKKRKQAEVLDEGRF